MTKFDDADVQRLGDTTLHRNRMKVTSPDSGKTYLISQRTTDLVWCCSCWSWRRSQPSPCKHLRALGLVNGVDEPEKVVLDRIGALRWTVQQLRAKVDGPPRAKVSRARPTPIQDKVDEAVVRLARPSRRTAVLDSKSPSKLPVASAVRISASRKRRAVAPADAQSDPNPRRSSDIMSVLAESLADDGVTLAESPVSTEALLRLLNEFEDEQDEQDEYHIGKKRRLASFLSERLKELYP